MRANFVSELSGLVNSDLSVSLPQNTFGGTSCALREYTDVYESNGGSGSPVAHSQLARAAAMNPSLRVQAVPDMTLKPYNVIGANVMCSLNTLPFSVLNNAALFGAARAVARLDPSMTVETGAALPMSQTNTEGAVVYRQVEGYPFAYQVFDDGGQGQGFNSFARSIVLNNNVPPTQARTLSQLARAADVNDPRLTTSRNEFDSRRPTSTFGMLGVVGTDISPLNSGEPSTGDEDRGIKRLGDATATTRTGATNLLDAGRDGARVGQSSCGEEIRKVPGGGLPYNNVSIGLNSQLRSSAPVVNNPVAPDDLAHDSPWTRIDSSAMATPHPFMSATAVAYGPDIADVDDVVNFATQGLFSPSDYDAYWPIRSMFGYAEREKQVNAIKALQDPFARANQSLHLAPIAFQKEEHAVDKSELVQFLEQRLSEARGGDAHTSEANDDARARRAAFREQQQQIRTSQQQGDPGRAQSFRRAGGADAAAVAATSGEVNNRTFDATNTATPTPSGSMFGYGVVQRLRRMSRPERLKRLLQLISRQSQRTSSDVTGDMIADVSQLFGDASFSDLPRDLQRMLHEEMAEYGTSGGSGKVQVQSEGPYVRVRSSVGTSPSHASGSVGPGLTRPSGSHARAATVGGTVGHNKTFANVDHPEANKAEARAVSGSNAYLERAGLRYDQGVHEWHWGANHRNESQKQACVQAGGAPRPPSAVNLLARSEGRPERDDQPYVPRALGLRAYDQEDEERCTPCSFTTAATIINALHGSEALGSFTSGVPEVRYSPRYLYLRQRMRECPYRCTCGDACNGPCNKGCGALLSVVAVILIDEGSVPESIWEGAHRARAAESSNDVQRELMEEAHATAVQKGELLRVGAWARIDAFQPHDELLMAIKGCVAQGLPVLLNMRVFSNQAAMLRNVKNATSHLPCNAVPRPLQCGVQTQAYVVPAGGGLSSDARTARRQLDTRAAVAVAKEAVRRITTAGGDAKSRTRGVCAWQRHPTIWFDRASLPSPMSVAPQAGTRIRHGQAVVSRECCISTSDRPKPQRTASPSARQANLRAHARSTPAGTQTVDHPAASSAATTHASRERKYSISGGISKYCAHNVYNSAFSLPEPEEGTSPMGHCVCVVGYSDDYGALHVRNTLGGEWGAAGDFNIPYSLFGVDPCGTHPAIPIPESRRLMHGVVVVLPSTS